ncbi:MAG TPA: hypothetical protein VFV54_04800 [Thermoanaerobaculia bacterium]|nr:hypothetical protein [Thermoanaerobaculia bacterium]
MRFEIERTILKKNERYAASRDGGGVERFIEAGETPGDAVRRFLSRDRSILNGDLVTIGRESVGTAENDDGLYLLRLHAVEDRA